MGTKWRLSLRRRGNPFFPRGDRATAALVERFERVGEIPVAVVLGRLRLVEGGLGLVPPAGQALELTAVVLDHRERAPFGRVEIADHLLAHHGVEADARAHAKTLGFLVPQPGRFLDRRTQRGVKAALVGAGPADRLLH
jgi:hypothetical protein